MSDSLSLGEPSLGDFDLGGVEVSNLCPRLLADQGDPLDLGAVRRRELDVVPKGVQVPPVEVVELGEDVHLAFPGQLSVHQWDELLVDGPQWPNLTFSNQITLLVGGRVGS